jgi:hypothetical protein
MLGSSGGWITTRALRHLYDRTPMSGGGEPYYGTETPARSVKGACLWIGAASSSRSTFGNRTTLSGPALLVSADDPIKLDDEVANVREPNGTVYYVGPGRVVGLITLAGVGGATLQEVTLAAGPGHDA